MKKLSFLLFFVFLFSVCTSVSAHEAYVLPLDGFWTTMSGPFSNIAFDAFKNPNNVKITLMIVVSVVIALGLNFAFRLSPVGQKLDAFFERFSHLGPHFVRISISIALIFSALSSSFLGPELSINSFSNPIFVKGALLVSGVLIAFGFLTEIAALTAILLFIYSLFVFGSYVFTYLNYLGEFIVLLLFGMRVFSLDKYVFGPLKRLRHFERYETVIVRVMYGLALAFAGITVKLLHPDLTIEVINTWHLTQFHWLFPSDPLLVTFGAGIVEMVIGLFIIFGFEMRLTVLVSLFYITLSLLYFRELVWPHLLLYGISLNLLVQPETLTLDHFFFTHHRRVKSWWKRIFAPHNTRGKSSVNR